MILIIDNYDSFTYNLYQYVKEFCNNVKIKKNDAISINQIELFKYSHIIISPGPGSPNNSGICLEVVENFYKKIPILGVCLGHQVIGQAFKAKIKEHSSVCHGKVSTIIHDQSSLLYKNIPEKFQATRYHSLVIDKYTLNSSFKINATLEDGTIMGIEHNQYKLFGVQFHPESIETSYGMKIIENFINIV